MNYYDGSFFPLDKDHRMLLDERERSFGRSSFWLNKATKRAYKSKDNKFLFLRRKEREIDEILRVGFGKNLLLTDYYNKFYREKGLHFDVKRGIIYLKNAAINPKNKISEHVGYIKDLNSTKGLDLMDCDLILFDEYIAEKRSDYKGGDAGIHEPEIFLHLVHTVFRNGLKYHTAPKNGLIRRAAYITEPNAGPAIVEAWQIFYQAQMKRSTRQRF